MNTFGRALLGSLALALATGCGGGDGAEANGGGAGSTAGGGGTPASGGDGGAGAGNPGGGSPGVGGTTQSGCEGTAPVCTHWNTRAVCQNGAFVEETCAAGCFLGQCSAEQCADECLLGETTAEGTCRLWDMNSGTFTDADPNGSLHDRARDYVAWLPGHQLAAGMVADARFSDSSLSELVAYEGVVDAALWTGSLLAAESWRHSATGAPDAASKIYEHTKTLHRAFGVTGIPGFLARFVLPQNSTEPVSINCPAFKHHCGVEWEGELYNWKGDTSRDQYTGVMLGYMLAYRTSPDAEVKDMIRQDVVTLALELMKKHEKVPVHVNIDGLEFDAALDVENTILVPIEMTDGKIKIEIDSSDAQGARMDGVREFLPDWSLALKQIPLLAWLPAIPRPGSAAMLGAFFRMALSMTEGVPGYEAKRAEIEAYFLAHAGGWLDIAEQWTYSKNCGAKYYGTHIEYVMAYTWARIETEPTLLSRIRDTVVDQRLWAGLNDHKNVYYAFLWGDTRPTPDAAVIADAASELALFQPGPRVHASRDKLNEYPHDPDCSSGGVPMSAVATHIDDRVVSDFMWQRQPWKLTDGGDPLAVFPGVDYLGAYWLGRTAGFIPEDRPGTCTRFEP